MSNRVTISVKFSFKGQEFRPEVTIELDEYVQRSSFPDFHQLIAKKNNYDLYSYEYEMIQGSAVIFENAEGLVAQFISDGVLSFEQFEHAWHQQHAELALKNLVKENLPLKEALFKAYQLGLNSRD